ncbi:MAG: DNA primase catalytic subunit PriS [Candidatus Methanoperedens sp.]|nr:DNA primase catalytic subunit PriS [Candidatus Methanoperedens sp.]MCZ7394523.1 DNA primase catalytic subunit PriS [Candidatus Methanoperedens sp.]
MNFRTKQYLRKRFGDYYRASKLTLPPELARREWGFIFFDELPEVVMRRHKAFNSESEALEYLGSMVPAHVYHSAAYYRFPGAATMKEKQWQGADLIFDLDADHLPQKPKSYAEMLSNVKAETIKLLDFLLEDFGFSEDNMSIAFSGGRGYHIHIRDPKVMMLESAERREIVDYVSGTGLSIDFLFKPAKHKVYDTGKFRKKELQSSRRIASFEEVTGGFGWGKRISQYLIHFLKDISKKDDEDAINDIIELIKSYRLKNAYSEKLPVDIVERIIQMKNENRKIGLLKIADDVGVATEKIRDVLIANDMWDFKAEASIKLKNLQKIARNPKSLEMIENKGFIDDSIIFDAIVQKAIEENSINLGSAHTDEPVTADVKRLIRMASSLHGGSGMRVVPLSLALLPEFEPLNEAVVFGENEIKIEVISPLKPQNSVVEMKGKSFTVTEGINTLPEYAAVYLMCRGAAEYA